MISMLRAGIMPSVGTSVHSSTSRWVGAPGVAPPRSSTDSHWIRRTLSRSRYSTHSCPCQETCLAPSTRAGDPCTPILSPTLMVRGST
jgi:hypothetical protein